MLNLQYFTSADRISMQVLKFAKFIPERRNNNLQSQKFSAGQKTMNTVHFGHENTIILNFKR